LLTYLRLSTHTLTVTLTDSSGVAVTGAVVTVTVVDQAGTQVAGQAWPLTLTDAGAGKYTGTIEHDLSVSVGQRLKAQITATKAGVQRYAEAGVTVEVDAD